MNFSITHRNRKEGQKYEWIHDQENGQRVFI